MPPSKAGPALDVEVDSLFPNIEQFVESATGDDIAALFAPIREGLDALKGPKVEQAKKVRLCLDRAEELLRHLIEVRGRMEAQRKSQR